MIFVFSSTDMRCRINIGRAEGKNQVSLHLNLQFVLTSLLVTIKFYIYELFFFTKILVLGNFPIQYLQRQSSYRKVTHTKPILPANA